MTRSMGKIYAYVAVALMTAAQISSADIITLQGSIDIALKNNPQILSAKQKVDISSAKMGQAGSSMLPQITANFGVGKMYSQPATVTLPPSMGGGTFATSPDEPSDSLSYSVTATQMLFAGGHILQGISAANAGYEVADQDYRKTRDDVTFNVISSYFDVLKSQKSLSTINDTILSLEKHVRQTELFNRSGISSKADLLRAQSELANANISKISAQMGLELAKLAFKTTLGTNTGTNFDIQEPSTTFFPEKEVSKEQVLKMAFENRPDWISYKLGMSVAQDAIGYSYGSYLPVVMYQFSAGKNISNYNSAGLDYDLNNWRSMIVASWNIFDGFNTANKIREAYANLNSAKAQESSIQDGIDFEVSSAYLTLQGTKEKVEASKIANDLARKAMYLADIAFASNTGSNIAYLDALAANVRAETALWSNIYDLEVAKARINKVTGTAVY